MPIDALLAALSQHHFPNPPATPAQIAAFESRVGWKLDADLRAFYLHCDGAALFESPPDANYRILPLAEIRRARLAVFGRDDDAYGSPSLYALVDMQDTNYVVVDVEPKFTRYPLFDAFHETFPAVEQIAPSFGDFLMRALDSGGRSFWLEE
ncbi:SMI1/KNR4 family protein [Myxococcus sp. AM010]|uniref:SMI1/KNR4 family protein n=1 Tax=Myxococcus sp. AM010 TaxID=2745138 RepID=UPI0015951734|nr:SMI1/KNR4 family protein [Myxococcus sp. AM010]NVJ17887.1 SMI1/KNR4 family protein [Myxococcus sp. AM010]